MIEFLNLLRQQRRCRKGSHVWFTVFVGRASDCVECEFCGQVAYLLHDNGQED